MKKTIEETDVLDLKEESPNIVKTFIDILRNVNSSYSHQVSFKDKYNEWSKNISEEWKILEDSKLSIHKALESSRIIQIVATSILFLCLLESCRNEDVTFLILGFGFYLLILAINTVSFAIVSHYCNLDKYVYDIVGYFEAVSLTLSKFYQRVDTIQRQYHIRHEFYVDNTIYKRYLPREHYRFKISLFSLYNVYGIPLALLVFCLTYSMQFEILMQLESLVYYFAIGVAIINDMKISAFTRQIKRRQKKIRLIDQGFKFYFENEYKNKTVVRDSDIKDEVLSLFCLENSEVLEKERDLSFVILLHVSNSVLSNHLLKYNLKSTVLFLLYGKHYDGGQSIVSSLSEKPTSCLLPDEQPNLPDNLPILSEVIKSGKKPYLNKGKSKIGRPVLSSPKRIKESAFRNCEQNSSCKENSTSPISRLIVQDKHIHEFKSDISSTQSTSHDENGFQNQRYDLDLESQEKLQQELVELKGQIIKVNEIQHEVIKIIEQFPDFSKISVLDPASTSNAANFEGINTSGVSNYNDEDKKDGTKFVGNTGNNVENNGFNEVVNKTGNNVESESGSGVENNSGVIKSDEGKDSNDYILEIESNIDITIVNENGKKSHSSSFSGESNEDSVDKTLHIIAQNSKNQSKYSLTSTINVDDGEERDSVDVGSNTVNNVGSQIGDNVENGAGDDEEISDSKFKSITGNNVESYIVDVIGISTAGVESNPGKNIEMNTGNNVKNNTGDAKRNDDIESRTHDTNVQNNVFYDQISNSSDVGSNPRKNIECNAGNNVESIISDVEEMNDAVESKSGDNNFENTVYDDKEKHYASVESISSHNENITSDEVDNSDSGDKEQKNHVEAASNITEVASNITSNMCRDYMLKAYSTEADLKKVSESLPGWDVMDEQETCLDMLFGENAQCVDFSSEKDILSQEKTNSAKIDNKSENTSENKSENTEFDFTVQHDVFVQNSPIDGSFEQQDFNVISEQKNIINFKFNPGRKIIKARKQLSNMSQKNIDKLMNISAPKINENLNAFQNMASTSMNEASGVTIPCNKSNEPITYQYLSDIANNESNEIMTYSESNDVLPYGNSIRDDSNERIVKSDDPNERTANGKSNQTIFLHQHLHPNESECLNNNQCLVETNDNPGSITELTSSNGCSDSRQMTLKPLNQSSVFEVRASEGNRDLFTVGYSSCQNKYRREDEREDETNPKAKYETNPKTTPLKRRRKHRSENGDEGEITDSSKNIFCVCWLSTTMKSKHCMVFEKDKISTEKASPKKERKIYCRECLNEIRRGGNKYLPEKNCNTTNLKGQKDIYKASSTANNEKESLKFGGNTENQHDILQDKGELNSNIGKTRRRLDKQFSILSEETSEVSSEISTAGTSEDENFHFHNSTSASDSDSCETDAYSDVTDEDTIKENTDVFNTSHLETENNQPTWNSDLCVKGMNESERFDAQSSEAAVHESYRNYDEDNRDPIKYHLKYDNLDLDLIDSSPHFTLRLVVDKEDVNPASLPKWYSKLETTSSTSSSVEDLVISPRVLLSGGVSDVPHIVVVENNVTMSAEVVDIDETLSLTHKSEMKENISSNLNDCQAYKNNESDSVIENRESETSQKCLDNDMPMINTLKSGDIYDTSPGGPKNEVEELGENQRDVVVVDTEDKDFHFETDSLKLNYRPNPESGSIEVSFRRRNDVTKLVFKSKEKKLYLKTTPPR